MTDLKALPPEVVAALRALSGKNLDVLLNNKDILGAAVDEAKAQKRAGGNEMYPLIKERLGVDATALQLALIGHEKFVTEVPVTPELTAAIQVVVDAAKAYRLKKPVQVKEEKSSEKK